MRNGRIRTPDTLRAVLRTDGGTHLARFQELVRCDFPLPGWEPIAVEIPPEGRRSQFGRPPRADHPLRDLSTVLHLPRYLDGEEAGTDGPPPATPHFDDRSRLLAATPLLGVATRTEHPAEDGLRSRSASVLLAWASGTSVVVTLDLAEGTCPDGLAGPEWHLRASQGLSLARAFEVLDRESRPAGGGAVPDQWLYVAPGLLGRSCLGDGEPEGRATPWTDRWRCEGAADLQERLGRLARSLSGLSVEIQSA